MVTTLPRVAPRTVTILAYSQVARKKRSVFFFFLLGPKLTQEEISWF